MNNMEFKEARKKLGLSQEQLGLILNTNIRTIQKWEAPPDILNSRHPNPVASVVIGWFLDGFRPPNWPLDK
jgi:DNA-binding transcriptional regulator YiaG